MKGLDRESSELALDSIRDFANQKLPPERLLEWDARDEMPLELVREMCGPGLGIQLLFLPEDVGGMGGGAFDVYRCCEALARVELDRGRLGGFGCQRGKWLLTIVAEPSPAAPRWIAH